MLKTVLSRLDDNLRVKWASKSAKIKRNSQGRTVLFKDFCKWIDEIAATSDECEGYYGTDYMKTMNTTNDDKSSTATPRPTGRGANSQSSSRSPPRPSGRGASKQDSPRSPPRPTGRGSSNTWSGTWNSNNRGRGCYSCNQDGHMVRDCPQADRQSPGTSYEASNSGNQDRSADMCPACNATIGWMNGHLLNCSAYRRATPQEKRRLIANKVCILCLKKHTNGRRDCVGMVAKC